MDFSANDTCLPTHIGLMLPSDTLDRFFLAANSRGLRGRTDLCLTAASFSRPSIFCKQDNEFQGKISCGTAVTGDTKSPVNHRTMVQAIFLWQFLRSIMRVVWRQYGYDVGEVGEAIVGCGPCIIAWG